MPARYNITSNGAGGGSQMLPVGTGENTYTSIAIGSDSSRVDCYVEFFDSNMNPTTPTAGTIHFFGLPMSNNWVEAVNSPVNASDVSYPDAKYTPAYMNGLVTIARARFSGIVGAAFARVVIYKRIAS